MLTIGQQLNDFCKSDVALSHLPNRHLLLRLTIIHPETTLTQDVTLSISFRHSLTPYVALSLAMKLREEFSPTPPHINVIHGDAALHRDVAHHGNQWKTQCIFDPLYQQ